MPAGFSNLHSVGRIRMRPVTDPGPRPSGAPRKRSAIVVPPRIRHPADQDVVLRTDGHDGNRTRRGPVDPGRPDVFDAVSIVHALHKAKGFVLGAVTDAVDRGESEDLARRAGARVG